MMKRFSFFNPFFLSRVQYFCLRVSSRPQHRWEIVFDEKRRGWNRTEVERTTSWDFAISDSRDEKKETVRKRNVVKKLKKILSKKKLQIKKNS